MSIRDLIPWKREERNLPVRREEESPLLALQRDMNQLFDEFSRGWGLMPAREWGEMGRLFTPQIDVVEKDDEIRVSAELPGMDEDDIDVSLSRGVLTISGEKREEREDRGENYHRVERSYGSFRRSVGLPAEVDTDEVEAVFKKGVLTVVLPKTAQGRSKKVSIKTE